MNASKGQRRELKIRLPEAVVERLEAERDARHAAGLLRPVDGIPALIEEAVALRHDRDAELAKAREDAAALRGERDAWKRTAIENGREARKWRGKAREAGFRRQVRAQARLPAPEPPQPPEAVLEAFRRDHGLPPPTGHVVGSLAGFCPACGPPPAAQGGPPPPTPP